MAVEEQELLLRRREHLRVLGHVRGERRRAALLHADHEKAGLGAAPAAAAALAAARLAALAARGRRREGARGARRVGRGARSGARGGANDAALASSSSTRGVMFCFVWETERARRGSDQKTGATSRQKSHFLK